MLCTYTLWMCGMCACEYKWIFGVWFYSEHIFKLNLESTLPERYASAIADWSCVS